MKRCVKQNKCLLWECLFKKKELAVNMSLFPAPKDRTIPTPDWQFRLKRMEVWPGSLDVLLDLQNVMYFTGEALLGKLKRSKWFSVVCTKQSILHVAEHQ